MKPKSGGLYLHSSSEPFNEEGQLSYNRVDLWLEHFGLNRVQSHCSGHSKGKDLLEIVQSINSDMLFPIIQKVLNLTRKLQTRSQLYKKQRNTTFNRNDRVCSSAWIERVASDHQVGGSNPPRARVNILDHKKVKTSLN